MCHGTLVSTPPPLFTTKQASSHWDLVVLCGEELLKEAQWPGLPNSGRNIGKSNIAICHQIDFSLHPYLFVFITTQLQSRKNRHRNFDFPKYFLWDCSTKELTAQRPAGLSAIVLQALTVLKSQKRWSMMQNPEIIRNLPPNFSKKCTVSMNCSIYRSGWVEWVKGAKDTHRC